MKQILKTNEKGFTLVELAIVMIIIGLLIGGVLKGQELIENAKVTSTISQVKGFQAALVTFRDSYAATPGDMINASDRLQGCDEGTNCQDGDGDSLIEFGTDTDPVWDLVNGTLTEENAQAWKHMALADLITGVDVTTGDDPAAWGASHPASSLRGGYQLYFDSDLEDVADATASGHVLRMSNGGLSGTVGEEGSAPASGLQAANIDRKLDDGRPGSGTVLGGGEACVSEDDVTAYNEMSDQKNCVPYFLIDG